MFSKPKVRAVIYWPDTEQVSIEDIGIINEEDRYHDAKTTVIIKGKAHKAVVRLISSDKLKLEAEEEKVDAEIEQKLKVRQEELAKAGGRGQRKRSAPQKKDVASSNQVAAACGERLQPSNDQASKVKQLSKNKKTAAAAQKSAHDDVDKSALQEIQTTKKQGACRALEFDKPGDNNSSSVHDADNALPASDSEREDPASENENSVHEYQTDDEEMDAQLDTSKCCAHCSQLRKACHQSPALFVQALSKYIGTSSASTTQYIEVLDVPADTARCELSKGSKVFISISDKNAIKRKGCGDPAQMTRLGLLALFGRDTMAREQITAKGQRAGSKGIKKNVRDALLAFVNRNRGETYPELDETKFNQVINKKKSSIHRLRKSPSSTGKVKKAKSSKTVTAEIQKSPSKLPGKSPSKSPHKSPAKSPFRQNSSAMKRRRSPFDSKTPEKIIQSPSKTNWEVSSDGVDSNPTAWQPTAQPTAQPAAPSNSNFSQGFSGYYSNQPAEYSYSYNSSYPVGQGNYSCQPETWYQNYASYAQ